MLIIAGFAGCSSPCLSYELRHIAEICEMQQTTSITYESPRPAGDYDLPIIVFEDNYQFCVIGFLVKVSKAHQAQGCVFSSDVYLSVMEWMTKSSADYNAAIQELAINQRVEKYFLANKNLIYSEELADTKLDETRAKRKAHAKMIYSIEKLNHRLLATTSSDGLLKIWDYQNLTCCNQYKLFAECKFVKKFMNQDLLLASASNLAQINWGTFVIKKNKAMSKQPITAISFLSQDQICLGLKSGAIQIYEFQYQQESWLQISQIDNFQKNGLGHKGQVLAVCSLGFSEVVSAG